MFRTEAHVGIRGEMNYQFRAFHRLRQTLPVEQLCLMKSKLRMRQGTLQKASLSGRHIIEPDDAVARGQQAVDHVTADKACSAGD
jgi:hypothetical protein